MTQNDPTDHALAAIASILDQPESHWEHEARRDPDAAHELEIGPEPEIRSEPMLLLEPEADVVEEKPLVPEMVEPSGYSKVGPGPMAAIRFKWTVRHEAHDQYYVDETIGESGSPITLGPMSGDAAIKLVDDRESDAQRRFEQLRNEMTGRPATAGLVRHDSSES